MTRYSWHKRNHDDALNGMMNLTLEERGAYNTLLDLMYQRQGAIPDDARWIAGWLGCSLRKWTTIRASLIVKGKLFEVNLNGVPSLANQRVEREVSASKTERNSRETQTKPQRNSRENEVGANENKPLEALDIDREREEERTPCSPPEGGAPKARGSRTCPTDWRPKDEHFAAALEDGLTRPEVEREALKFRNHDFRRPIKNWDRAFANWLIKALEIRQERNRPPPPARRVGWV